MKRRYLLLLTSLTLVLLAGCSKPSAPLLRAPKPLAVRSGNPRAETMLEPLRRKAAEAGAGPMTVIGVAIARTNDQLGGFVERLDARCVLAFAHQGQGRLAVELYVFADDGRMLGVAPSRAGKAALMVCDPEVDRLYVAARIVRGRGLLALGVQAVKQSKSEAVARAVGAAGYVAATGSALELELQGQRRAAAMRAELSVPFGVRKRKRLPLHAGASSLVSLRVGARRCLHAVAIQQTGLGITRMRLLSETGRVVARGQQAGGDSWLLLCSPRGGEYTLQLRGGTGRSLVWVELAESKEGAAHDLAGQVWFDSAGGVGDLKTAVRRYQQRLGSQPMQQQGTRETVNLRSGRLHSRMLKLPAGCRRVDVVAAAPLGALSASLWSDKGLPVDRTVGFELSSLFDCGVATTRRLELRSLDQGAAVSVTVRIAPQPAANLLKLPRAAARLWRKLDGASGRAAPLRMRSARMFQLQANGERALEITLPIKACVRLTVASDSSPVRLRDDGSTSAWFAAEKVQQRRYCGGDRPTQHRVYVRNQGERPVQGLWLVESE